MLAKANESVYGSAAWVPTGDAPECVPETQEQQLRSATIEKVRRMSAEVLQAVYDFIHNIERYQ